VESHEKLITSSHWAENRSEDPQIRSRNANWYTTSEVIAFRWGI